MSEKYSTPTAYLWGITTTILGFFTLEQWVAIVGIICTIGHFQSTCLPQKGVRTQRASV